MLKSVKFVISILICQLTGVIGSVFTSSAIPARHASKTISLAGFSKKHLND